MGYVGMVQMAHTTQIDVVAGGQTGLSLGLVADQAALMFQLMVRFQHSDVVPFRSRLFDSSHKFSRALTPTEEVSPSSLSLVYTHS